MTSNFETYVTTVFAAVTTVFTAVAAKITDETIVNNIAATSVKFSSHVRKISFSGYSG